MMPDRGDHDCEAFRASQVTRREFSRAVRRGLLGLPPIDRDQLRAVVFGGQLRSLTATLRRPLTKIERINAKAALRALEAVQERALYDNQQWAIRRRASRLRMLELTLIKEQIRPELERRVRERQIRGNELRRTRMILAHVEHVDRDVVYIRDDGICGLCDEPVPRSRFTLDHKVPIARGGAHSYANVQLAHKSCNSRKGAR